MKAFLDRKKLKGVTSTELLDEFNKDIDNSIYINMKLLIYKKNYIKKELHIKHQIVDHNL